MLQELLYCSTILILGFALGFIASYLIMKPAKRYSGVLRVDRSDQDGPLLFLELSEDISYISEQESVTFVVNNHNILPHE